MSDLREIYGSVNYDAAVFEDSGEVWPIDGSTFPLPPTHIDSAEVVIFRGERFSDWVSYGNRNDIIKICAEARTYRILGFLMFATLFANLDHPVTLHLTHPQSKIKQLVIDQTNIDSADLPEGLHFHPRAFAYRVNHVSKYPLESQEMSRLEPDYDVYDLPRIILTSEENPQTEKYWNSRDKAIFCPNHDGHALFAQLLLDVSSGNVDGDEFHLQSHPNFLAVAPGSADISLLLPGSFGWPDGLKLG